MPKTEQWLVRAQAFPFTSHQFGLEPCPTFCLGIKFKITFFSYFFQSLSLKFFVLWNHYSFESFEIIANQNLSEYLFVTFWFQTLDNAFLKCSESNACLLNDTLDQNRTYRSELLELFGVVEFILFSILENGTVFFDKIQKGISPDGWKQILLDEIVNPFFLFLKFIVIGLFFFLSLWGSKYPIEHL